MEMRTSDEDLRASVSLNLCHLLLTTSAFDEPWWSLGQKWNTPGSMCGDRHFPQFERDSAHKTAAVNELWTEQARDIPMDWNDD